MSEEQYDNEVQPGLWDRVFGEQGDQPTFFQRLFGGLGGDSTPTILGVIVSSLVGTIGTLLLIAVGSLVWLALAATTFTFGYDYIGAWILKGWVGDGTSRFLAGALCVLLFDLTYTTLVVASFQVRSNAQRAICFLAAAIAFSAGIWASLTGFNLLSEAGTVEEFARQLAQQNGRSAVYIGLVNAAVSFALVSIMSPNNVATIVRAVIDSRHASQDQIAQLIMEDTAEKTFYSTVREEAYRLGHQRGQQAVNDFSNRWRLSDSAPIIINSDAPAPLQLEDSDDDPT